ncbi:indolepyruvate oxidoreductase subunit beta family protein [Sediminicola luteus]|uniref:DUF6537 domain-containing protein n=1 Tax=Sediminicola luteus TaxID=319238 RepID=A0A2A4GD44_9FLAO|nr:indolepyruvate oxidoreductase subunit beta family protein [Sediminicola luteus]PCE65904.1 hypothetical protein B7P33_00970 [Sediminicola luteus]
MSVAKKKNEPIKIALLAVGGDGGGVLSGWIRMTAEDNGYWAQSTSIAGVAQRTGATVYYMELMNKEGLEKDGKIQTPVLAQMPAPFDIDIVMATEIMEAGRAMYRDFVSDKTTLIFSTNRNLAIKEKETPGDGILDGRSIVELAEKHAKKSLFGNLKLIAEQHKSVISASMFGALAASGALPFTKQQFLDTIAKTGIAVQASSNAFNGAYDYIKDFIAKPKPYEPALKKAEIPAMPSSSKNKTVAGFINYIKSEFPKPIHDVVFSGVLHLADWHNATWAQEYLDKLKPFVAKDQGEYTLSFNLAKYLATAMAYDDLIFVADQKTRTERFAEVYDQIEAKPDDIVHTLDFLHPSFPEFYGFLPKKMGLKVSKNKKMEAWFAKRMDKDRRIKSTSLFWYLNLYFLGGMKRWRMKTFRHYEEMDNVDGWLGRIDRMLSQNYALAVDLAKTYRLKKGYGDTYARGHGKFWLMNEFIMSNADNGKAQKFAAHLMEVALQNPKVEALRKSIEEIEAN